MNTTYATKISDVERKWYVVDAEGVVLGRMAAEIAKILRGKHKANFVPNIIHLAMYETLSSILDPGRSQMPRCN